MTRNQKKIYMKKMRLQKLMGLLMIILSIVIASYVLNTSDPDITACLILGPIGIWMLFSKKCLIY